MIGILYHDHTASLSQVIADLLTKNHFENKCIYDETLTKDDLVPCSLLINTTPNTYPCEKLNLIVDFFNTGKNIINLGTNDTCTDIRFWYSRRFSPHSSKQFLCKKQPK